MKIKLTEDIGDKMGQYMYCDHVVTVNGFTVDDLTYWNDNRVSFFDKGEELPIKVFIGDEIDVVVYRIILQAMPNPF